MKRSLLVSLAVISSLIIGISSPEIRGQEADFSQTKKEVEIQKVVQLKVKIRTEREKEILKRIGLECEPGENVEDSELSRREVTCKTTVGQMSELKKEGIEFEVEREGIKIEKGGFGYKRVNKGKGSAYDDNENNYTIPEGDWNHSPITITSAPPTATVTSIDVYYEVIHTYIGDLVIKLTDQDLGHEWNLWYYEGGSGDNIEEAEWDITEFNGELVNQTWKLWGYDCCSGDDGYIDYWSIQIWYEDLPDLIVQSLTATDYNPNTGEYIDVTMVIKNQGTVSASGWFYNGLFYDLSSPPDINTWEDDWWSTSDLDPGETESHTFYNITSYEAGTWHTYGLADCDGDITESNENNNYIGPVSINWTYVPPDLIVQDLTVDNPSLVITEHTNGTITIKNQSSVPVTEEFRTDVFKDTSTAPTPPASGQYRWQTYSLGAGETRTYNFYKLPHSTSAGTWKMWGLVDSQGDIQESNEGNNAYGPVNITWLDPPSPDSVSRADMIAHALEFVNVEWTCSGSNATPHWSCPDDWTCAFSPGEHVTGEAYSYGGWDKPNTDFLTYLSAGLCAGSYSSNNCGQTDAYWATGVDCSGLISRSWELPSRRTTSDLRYVSYQISINDLRSGDIMNNPGSHVMMFYEWINDTVMKVIESTPPQVTDEHEYYVQELLDDGYVPYKYSYVYDPDNNNPVFTESLHCKYPQEECNECIKYGDTFVLEVDAYDPDGDPIYYVWFADWGWFIVDEDTIYCDTTAENFITYLAPSFYPNYDRLQVTVHDNRGGWAFTEGWLGLYDPETSCLCGDVNVDGAIQVADIVFLVTYLYLEGPPPYEPIERADVNNDCVVDVADLIYLVNYCFGDGPPPECGWICPPDLKTPNSGSHEQTAGKAY